MIHNTAIIHPDADIDESVHIGPYTCIGADVKLGANCDIGSHVVINGPTTIGKNNKIYQFASIGEDPQDKKFEGEQDSFLEIGDNNLIREYCSINRGTHHGGGVTRIGNNNWIMAYVHIAHDCLVGDDTVFANNVTLAGHVKIDNNVILGGFTGVHQFCHIGRYSFSAISSVIVKDVPPYLMVCGNSAKPNGLNKEGLKRNGFDEDTISVIKKAYKNVYREGLLLKEALNKVNVLAEKSPDVKYFYDFIKNSDRGIVR